MLDESMIGKPLPKEPLKCEGCGQIFCEDEFYDWESIDEHGFCMSCMDEGEEERADVVRDLNSNG